jgi:hypothetical protein
VSDEGYQGWTNRETWAAHLWLSNDPDVFVWAREQTADTLKTAFEVAAASREASGFWYLALRDIGSLWRVDWNQIARALAG